jgi:hypothetical protein
MAVSFYTHELSRFFAGAFPAPYPTLFRSLACVFEPDLEPFAFQISQCFVAVLRTNES